MEVELPRSCDRIFAVGEWLAVARPKILLVDDTRLVLELEKSFLKLSHVDVLTAMNGVEALEMIRKDPPDLIFMDMNMPIMDGITCCTQLKADPFMCSIPVIMLTTAGREGDRERASQAGCDGFLTKPIDRREFLEIARQYADAVDRRDIRVPCQFPAVYLIGKTAVDNVARYLGDDHNLLKTTFIPSVLVTKENAAEAQVTLGRTISN